MSDRLVSWSWGFYRCSQKTAFTMQENACRLAVFMYV